MSFEWIGPLIICEIVLSWSLLWYKYSHSIIFIVSVSWSVLIFFFTFNRPISFYSKSFYGIAGSYSFWQPLTFGGHLDHLHLMWFYRCLPSCCFSFQYSMTLISFFGPLWESGRVCPVHVFVPCVANSPHHHLGSRRTVGRSEEEIRKWNKAARRRESSPKCEAPEFSAPGKSRINAGCGRGVLGPGSCWLTEVPGISGSCPDLITFSILGRNKRTQHNKKAVSGHKFSRSQQRAWFMEAHQRGT